MGQVKDEVVSSHLLQHHSEETLLKPFLNGFDVTWGRRRQAYNTELSTYFLRPEPFITQMFGFEHEVALFISNYPTLEARTMQAVDRLMGDDPAKGRVEQGVFFLCTPANDGRQWVSDYTARNPQARIPVVFNNLDVLGRGNDAWLVRNVLRDQLFSRDLFDYQLPLDSDLFFFGRDQIIADHMDAIRRSQNRGLFGLRKTGKTSLLYKLQRLIQREDSGALLYYDCKLPSIRMLKWNELLARIVQDIAKAYGQHRRDVSDDPRRISEEVLAVLRDTPHGKTISLVFDEIEYISPLAVDDQHWHKDFVPFWQTLWSAQSQVRRLSCTVVGVNPTIVEMDNISGVQNPMFGIIQPRYLKGLALEEMRNMIRVFGRRMGLSFSLDASEYLHKRYGGHPLLTRMACSEIHQTVERQSCVRPVQLTANDLRRDEESRDAELTFYCRHVVSELKKFYPEEYAVLEMLASGQVTDVMDLSDEPEYTRHLKEYGLLQTDAVGRPSFAIPVLGRHVGSELARRERRRLVRWVVPLESRGMWVRKRTETITRELRELCTVAEVKGLSPIYCSGGFSEVERFLASSDVSNNDEFVAFINVCNRCLVESAVKAGKNLGKNDYYWTTLKQVYPDLWDGLQRVKIYRHNDLHLELNASTEAELRRYIEQDLEGRRIAQVPDVWFVFQQSVLDGLLIGVQCELNRYN